MSAAALQGSAVVTHDFDIWVGSPMSEHDCVLLVCHELGAELFDDFHVQLSDTTLINFTYEMVGLRSFERELRDCLIKRHRGVAVPLLPLHRIYASKQAANRPKDRAHLFYLRRLMRLRKETKTK